MTCYRGQSWIGQSIESVLSQDYENLELLIVNDASPDDSSIILEDYRCQDPRVRIFANPSNLGIPASRNRGLQEMKGEFFCILDQDDLWKPGKASRQTQYLREHSSIKAVYCKSQHIDEKGRLGSIRALPYPSSGNLFETFFKKGVAAPFLSFMFRSSLLETVGSFNETLKGQDDFEFLLRVAHVTAIELIPEVLVEQRSSPGTFGQSEAMTLDQLHLAGVLERIWPQYPRFVRRYRSRAHYNVAHFFAKSNQMDKASYHFSHSGLNRPWFLKAWWFWFSLRLPEKLRTRLPRTLRLSEEKYK